MKITLKGTALSLTPALKTYVEEKLPHLDKFLHKIQIARVELEKLHTKDSATAFRAEVNLDTPGKVFRAESWASDAYSAFNTVLPKLVAQLEKQKTKYVLHARQIARQRKNMVSNI